jgi:hypothetical protein
VLIDILEKVYIHFPAFCTCQPTVSVIHAFSKENKMKLTQMMVSTILAFVAILVFISFSCSQSSQADQQSSQSSTATQGLLFTIDYPTPKSIFPPCTIRVEGRYNYDTSQHIWIILSDGIGYYLQNPEVSPSATNPSKWEQCHVCLGPGIRSIIAVLVTNNGHRVFQNMVRNGMWGQIELPDGTRRLAQVSITIQ